MLIFQTSENTEGIVSSSFFSKGSNYTLELVASHWGGAKVQLFTKGESGVWQIFRNSDTIESDSKIYSFNIKIILNLIPSGEYLGYKIIDCSEHTRDLRLYVI